MDKDKTTDEEQSAKIEKSTEVAAANKAQSAELRKEITTVEPSAAQTGGTTNIPIMLEEESVEIHQSAGKEKQPAETSGSREKIKMTE